MKSLLHIALAVLFLCQAVGTTLILVSFELNREEIARTLCLKKEEPDNCCQGSCHLKKQLQAEEKKEQAPGQSAKQFKLFPLFFDAKKDLILYSKQLNGLAFPPVKHGPIHSYSASVFHPPCTAA